MTKRVKKIPTDAGKSTGWWTSVKYGWCSGWDHEKRHDECPGVSNYGHCSCDCHKLKGNNSDS
jgi:hypothetical protein